MLYCDIMNKQGYYIWADATLVAGPFETESSAWDSLSPENREKWTWELHGGKQAFMKMPLKAFSVEYCIDPDCE